MINREVLCCELGKVLLLSWEALRWLRCAMSASPLYQSSRDSYPFPLSLSALILSGAHKQKRVHVEAFLYMFNGIYQGRITDWDMMSTIWEFSFRESGVSHCMDEMIVLTTENCDTNNKDAESALSIMFEQFNVKGESCYSFSACGI